jgi:hypothetical protein
MVEFVRTQLVRVGLNADSLPEEARLRERTTAWGCILKKDELQVLYCDKEWGREMFCGSEAIGLYDFETAACVPATDENTPDEAWTALAAWRLTHG